MYLTLTHALLGRIFRRLICSTGRERISVASASVLNRTAAAATEAATYYSLRLRRRQQRVVLRVSFAANSAVWRGSEAAVAAERSQPWQTAATCFAYGQRLLLNLLALAAPASSQGGGWSSASVGGGGGPPSHSSGYGGRSILLASLASEAASGMFSCFHQP